MSDVQAQRAYYERTANDYDSMHLLEGDEHFRALACDGPDFYRHAPHFAVFATR